MNKEYPTLYSRTTIGKVQTWLIEQNNNQYRTISGTQEGKKVISGWQFAEIKNEGRSNETSPIEQATKEILAKYEKKLKTGYYENIDDIDSMVYIEPMKAKKFIAYQDKIKYPVAIEDKLNGICCIRDKRGGTSYNGESFYCINHILEATEFLIKKYPNIYLHGELFNYKYKNLLNRIAALVSVNRKPDDVTDKDELESKEIIKLYIYDGYGFEDVTRETPYLIRKHKLKELLKDIPYIEYLEYKIVNNIKEVNAELAKTKKLKTEGIMVKLLDGKYEHKRSKFILKLKNWKDEEFEVIGIFPGTGNWAGCAKIITCKLKDGETFDSNIRGTQEELRILLVNKDKYIGKFCTVEFQEKSEYGIPLIPYTQLPFRDYEKK